MASREWTSEEEAAVIAEAREGRSDWRALAVTLDRTTVAVRRRAWQLGLSSGRASAAKRAWTPERRAAACKPRPHAGVPQSVETRAKRRATLKRLFADPAVRAAAIERLQAGSSKIDHVEKSRRGVATKLNWCPEYLRAEYVSLRRKMRSGTAEARAVILDDFARDLRRALRDIAAAAKPYAEEQRRQYRSFEAELERAKTRGIREVVHLHKPEFHLSLTGGSLS